tara:strand:+ start:18941 stop:19906 length:966 start_codon:yes stop_codon:yes gene_type:complete
MKNYLKLLIPKTIFCLTVIAFLTIVIFGCKTDKKQEDPNLSEVNKDSAIEIVTNVMDFQSVDTIPSRWNTFKYVNKSIYAHFFLLDKYPEGKNIQNTINEVGPPFDNGMAFIMEGKMNEAMTEFGKLPEWFGDIVFTGGSGLVSPGNTSLTTVKLDSGLYIMECYVKMANGKFHTSMGMAKELYVLEKDSGNSPPDADINITISSTEGIQYNGSITKGERIFSVYYKDQIVHENFVGHDVNIVKLDNNANLDVLEAWMNWATPTGLMDPIPEGFTFLGGTNDAPAGTTQYFKVNLEPDNYALISEVPNASKKGMLKTFTIE